jgi:hypothetical protein
MALVTIFLRATPSALLVAVGFHLRKSHCFLISTRKHWKEGQFAGFSSQIYIYICVCVSVWLYI